MKTPKFIKFRTPKEPLSTSHLLANFTPGKIYSVAKPWKVVIDDTGKALCLSGNVIREFFRIVDTPPTCVSSPDTAYYYYNVVLPDGKDAQFRVRRSVHEELQKIIRSIKEDEVPR